jgi:hypothetical protein
MQHNNSLLVYHLHCHRCTSFTQSSLALLWINNLAFVFRRVQLVYIKALVELLQAISAKGVELELECKTCNFQAQDYCSSKLFVFLLESMVQNIFGSTLVY